jgi:CRISPR-associated endonuclease Csn1
MKKILGLDLGTNSIGWALIELNDSDQKDIQGKILGIGSRIVPMDTDLLNNLEQGNSISKTADRRQARGARRLKQRYKLRRERLINILKILEWLPKDFKPGSILPYRKELVKEMMALFKSDEISSDWTVYYLRKKALTQRIELVELARILLHLNQRRGFRSNRKANNNEINSIESNEEKNNIEQLRNKKWVELVTIADIRPTEEKSKGKNVFEVTLDNGMKGRKIKLVFHCLIRRIG